MKKNSLFWAFCISVLFIFSVPDYAQSQSLSYTVLSDTINKSERDDRLYRVIELSNQMKVLLISDHNAVKSLASIALPVGSLHDPKTQQGLAHYTEHMVLMGSKKYPKAASFAEFLSQHAGKYNASTYAYRTAFYFEVENSAFEGALDRLADAIAQPLLDPKYANRERNAVDSELTMARSNDGFRIGQVDAETINQDHPAAMFSGGNLETLSDKPDSVLQTELEHFHHHYYSANIMVGVVYSNQSLDELALAANKTFGQITNREVKVDDIQQTAITTQNVGKMIYMEPAQAKKVLYIQFPIANNIAQFSDKSDEYIGYLIDNRSPNTLFDKLQKQGLIESINTNLGPMRYGNSGILSIFVGLTDQGLAQKDLVIGDIFAYLKLIAQQGINQQYYDEITKVLALDFKYPDITRDMAYVEWLSDQMLFYPVNHVLDADYIATHFNAETIAARLNSLTVDNARIWVIAPNQQTNKVAYFVNAPYRIDDISQQQKQRFIALAADSQFSLPMVNPYIVDDVTIFAQGDSATDSKMQPFDPAGNHFHFTSQYFANEPKANIIFSLRSNQALQTVENQVKFTLMDYIVNRELATLRFQASVAGVSLSSFSDSGLSLSLSGFNQHLGDMLIEMLATYHSATINDANLELAKSWYLEKLDAADHANSYTLALQTLGALSSSQYFDRESKRAVIPTISVSDLQQYRDELLFNSVPYMLSLGNMTEPQSLAIYNELKHTLNQEARYQIEPNIMIKKVLDANITKHSDSTDNALLVGYVPANVDSITGRVTSHLLYNIISPWFYDQLRSNEQLGYAVFALPIGLGDSYGVGFLIQSNQYDPAYLYQRYQAFYPTALDKLNELTESEFNQYKQSLINELSMPPQTLDEEFDHYLSDFSQSKFTFDSRQENLARLATLTQADLVDFYRKSITHPTGLTLVSQVLGTQPDKSINGIDGVTPYSGAEALQKVLHDQ